MPTLDEVANRLAALQQGFASSNPNELARQVYMAMANALLSKVLQNFEDKSRGGGGDDGVRWPPLSPDTIARRALSDGEKKAAGIKKNPVNAKRSTLTAEQDKVWKRVYWQSLSRARASGIQGGEARAAQQAWFAVKEMGAKSRRELFGHRQVDILRDTSELFRSLMPGVGSNPSGELGQIVRVGGGEITVGTDRKPWHHKGIPGRLPARPMWPDPIPDEWIAAMAQAGSDAIAAIIGTP